MPTAAPKPCIQCGTLVHDGTSRCAAHKARPGTFADRARGTRHQRGYGAQWDRIREQIMRRDAGICQPCLRHGTQHNAHAVDHIVPKERGGTDDDANLQAICREAHSAKTSAEKLGRVWDEAAWCAAHQAKGRGGVKKSNPHPAGTDLSGEFSRAQVLRVGGGL